MEYKATKANIVGVVLMLLAIMAILVTILLCACTYTFQNTLSTGAYDVVESDSKVSSDAQGTITDPVK